MSKQKPASPLLAPLSVARMLWKQRYLTLAVWVALASLGAFVVSKLPDVFSAEALVLVDPQKIPERFVASTVQVSPQDQLSTINQQILSTGKLQSIMDEFHLYTEQRRAKSPEEVVALMRQELRITPDKGWTGFRPSAFRISYEGNSPTIVASVVNRVAGLFIDESLKTREERAEGTSEFLDNQLQEARKTLETQEAILRDFKTRRMGELPEQQAALMATLTRLQADLQSNQDSVGRSEQNRIMLEGALHAAETTYSVLARSVGQREPAPATADAPPALEVTVVSKPKQSDQLQAQLDALRLRYSEDHPDVKRLRASLAVAQRREKDNAQLEALSQTVTKTDRSPVVAPAAPVNPQILADMNRERERIGSTKAQMAALDREIALRKADGRRIQAALAEYQGKVDRLPLREQEFASITRDFDNSRQNYRSLLDKKLSAEMAAAMERQQQSERFTLLDPAKVPTKPIKPKRPILFGAVLCISLALSLAFGFAIELPKNRILGEWELPSEVKVIGCISEIRISRPKHDGNAVGPRAVSWLGSLFLSVLTAAGLWGRRGAL